MTLKDLAKQNASAESTPTDGGETTGSEAAYYDPAAAYIELTAEKEVAK